MGAGADRFTRREPAAADDLTGDRRNIRAATSRWDLPGPGGVTDSAPTQLPVLNPAAWQGKQPPERLWALKDWIPARQATYLTGPGSAGKSLLAQQLCTCIALGLPFMGVPTQQAAAIYITCEDDEDELHRRQSAICKAAGVELADVHAKLFLASIAGWTGTALCHFDDTGRLHQSECFELLKTTVERAGSRFVVLDNVAHLYGGNENIRNEVAAFVNLLNGLALAIDGSVVLIGHPNKAGAEFSGSTAWENQVRSRLFLETPDEVDHDLRVLTAPKANYAPKGGRLTFRWYRGAFVRDDDLPEGFAEQIAVTVQATADNEIFLRCLDVRNQQERPVSESPSARTFAPKEFAAMAESKRIGRARLEAAMDRLFRIDAIGVGLVCRTGRKDRFGLLRKCADPCADPALTACADVRDVDAPTCADVRPHTPYTTYTGEGPEGPPDTAYEDRQAMG